jgi:ABC-2 type transport system ATP-binding protein
MLQAVVSFHGVSKRFGPVQALDEVSFDIPRGSIFGYIGPNGAGKTTTMKILVGLIQDYEGEVLVEGDDISKDRMSIHKKLGYLPQEVGFQEWRTVGQMLETFGRLSGIPDSEIRDRVRGVLETVDLPDVEDRKIAHLSGGMRQKMRLAQCLIHNPELLVLDEPMSGLDPASRHQVRSIIRGLSEDGATVLFSSHILSDVQDIATEIGILNKGQLMIVGSPEQLQDHFRIGNDIEVVVAAGFPMPGGVSNQPGVESVEELSSTRSLIHLAPDADVDTTTSVVLRRLVEANVPLRSFRLVQPSLEEVYIRYVGGDSQ